MISTKPLREADPEIAKLIEQEIERKEYSLELIPSENIVSEAVLEAAGSILTDKYCEGYPGRRYYGGCEYYDEIEKLACDRALQLFGGEVANVQPHSGSNANMAVYFGLLQPGDTVMGPKLDHGGHLTHGSKVNFSGKFYNIVGYGVDPQTQLYDTDQIVALAKEHKPKMIICGATAYSRQIDFEGFRKAADAAGAYLMADVSHYAGLIVGGVYKSPIDYADVVTTTTHKTLRGPRGGLIIGRTAPMKKISKIVFPGIQGGPLMHQIAAKAVAFREALQPEFKEYAASIIDNARALAAGLQKRGFDIVSGGTDSHVMIIDLRSQGITGDIAEDALGKAGITVNKNTIPDDPQPPARTSGVRIGTPAITSRGFTVSDMDIVADVIVRAITNHDNEAALAAARADVRSLCSRYPLYRHKAGTYWSAEG
ncbi:MAG: serine hydroxymethyltransferase [bacterium]|nr:serine hydroxymethyltransferase [bacterium]